MGTLVCRATWKEALRETGRGGVDNPAVKPLEDLPAFGRTIRKLRSRKGWSLTEAAEAIGLKTASWKQIEYGKAAVSDERMLAMAKAFGFSQIPLGWRRLRRESRQEPQTSKGADAQHLSAFGAVLRPNGISAV